MAGLPTILGQGNYHRRIREAVETGRLKIGSEPAICPRCYGTGIESTERGARRCECRRAAILAARQATIPSRYRDSQLDALRPRPDLHPKQAAAIELLRALPRDSFVLCGSPGSGKTHLLWALYRRVAEDLDRRVVAGSLSHLIEQYRETFRPQRDPDSPPPRPFVLPNDLAVNGNRWSLFLDDIDKPRMTEYVAEQVHALMDAVYNHKHQLVVTTNLRPDALRAHFARADERYGLAIVRRIIHEGSNLVELF